MTTVKTSRNCNLRNSKPNLVGIELNPGPPRKQRRGGRRRRLNPSTSLVRQPNLAFPTRMKRTLRYADNIILTNTAGVFNYNTYRMNSVFDPDFTNGGSNHQPLGYDQLSVIYSFYRVVEFIWKVNIVANGATNALGAVSLTSSTGSPGSVAAQAEFPWSSMQLLPVNQCRTFRGRIPLHQFTGQSNPVYNADDSNESVIGANPSRGLYFNIGSQSTGSTTNTINFALELDYVVEWYVLSALSQS